MRQKLHGLLEELLRLDVGRRPVADRLAAEGVQHERALLALVEHEASLGSPGRRDQRHLAGQRQAGAPARVFEEGAVRRDRHLRGDAGVVEGRLARDVELHVPADDGDAADDLVGLARRAGPARHEVLDLADAVGREKARQEHVGVGPVELLARADGCARADAEATPSCVVEQRAEDARRVELREAHPVDRSIAAHQRDGAHVADDAIALDGVVGHGVCPSAQAAPGGA